MLNIGDLLEATDSCEMERNGERTLTKGDAYTVEKIETVDDRDMFAVTDDGGCEHWFEVDEINEEFFKEIE